MLGSAWQWSSSFFAGTLLMLLHNLQKTRLVFQSLLLSPPFNSIYPLRKLGLYFLPSIQTVSGIAIDCTTDCSLYFSESQDLTDAPLK